jgi:hypothetical protein
MGGSECPCNLQKKGGHQQQITHEMAPSMRHSDNHDMEEHNVDKKVARLADDARRAASRLVDLGRRGVWMNIPGRDRTYVIGTYLAALGVNWVRATTGAFLLQCAALVGGRDGTNGEMHDGRCSGCGRCECRDRQACL